ncbi:UNVERIFIED_CONTAM: hypothetical protein K2H54_034957 [Gekko kuhli]
MWAQQDLAVCLSASWLFQALHLSIPVVSFHPEVRGRDQTEASSDKLSFNHNRPCSQVTGACSCEGGKEGEKGRLCWPRNTEISVPAVTSCIVLTMASSHAAASQLCVDIVPATGRGMCRLRPALVEHIFSF